MNQYLIIHKGEYYSDKHGFRPYSDTPDIFTFDELRNAYDEICDEFGLGFLHECKTVNF